MSIRRALALLVLLAGCRDSSPAHPVAVATPVDPATAGTLQVEVTFTGSVPAARELDMHSAPLCAAAHREPVYDPSFIVHDGHLANAVVWIKGGLERWVFAPPTTAVTIDQTGCRYAPHVVAAMVGQPVTFLNSDIDSHNVHGHPQVVSAWNFMLSHKGVARTVTFAEPEIGIPIGCDIHPWMHAYLSVVPHPYVAVTADDGRITLSHVPPGDYVVAAWHERLGPQEQHVSLAPSATGVVHFTYVGS